MRARAASAKAPSPLRFAGAVQIVAGHFVLRWQSAAATTLSGGRGVCETELRGARKSGEFHFRQLSTDGGGGAGVAFEKETALVDGHGGAGGEGEGFETFAGIEVPRADAGAVEVP